MSFVSGIFSPLYRSKNYLDRRISKENVKHVGEHSKALKLQGKIAKSEETESQVAMGNIGNDESKLGELMNIPYRGLAGE